MYPDKHPSEKFEYAAYGTLQFNNRDPIPVPTETLLLIAEEVRLLKEGGELDD